MVVVVVDGEVAVGSIEVGGDEEEVLVVVLLEAVDDEEAEEELASDGPSILKEREVNGEPKLVPFTMYRAKSLLTSSKPKVSTVHGNGLGGFSVLAGEVQVSIVWLPTMYMALRALIWVIMMDMIHVQTSHSMVRLTRG